MYVHFSWDRSLQGTVHDVNREGDEAQKNEVRKNNKEGIV
jgi:hypothetical protein